MFFRLFTSLDKFGLLGLRKRIIPSAYKYAINKATNVNTEDMFKKNSRLENRTLIGIIIVGALGGSESLTRNNKYD